MTWATWTNSPLVPSIALCSIVFVLWAFDPQVIQVNILFFLAVASLLISLAPERTTAIVGSIASIASTLINDYHISGLFVTNASMLVTGGATVWLLHRALQTLWRPVPELIDILGVEVPAPPDVSLTAIGVDKATITWTKPPSNRAVDKYVIQVNGVNVGESATSNDTFITVSGLKPNHFYNVRIIAVGSNNFQAGSRVLRLRTFGSDGRPRLGTARLASDLTDDDAASTSRQQDNTSGHDDSGSGKQFVTSVFGGAQASASEGPQMQSRDREGSSGVPPSSRRNTINRRHSPSTASLDYQQQQQQQHSSVAGGEDESGVDEAQMSELNKKYLNLRRETEEVTAQCAKEEEETKKVLEELEADKRKKRQEQKKKEEQTKKLTKEQNSTDRAMRAAQSQRAQKEKKLKEKTAELNRLCENIEKWDRSIKEMQKEQESHKQKRAEEDAKYQREANKLRENNKKQQAECARLEADLKNVRQAVKELEEGRNALPTAGDDSGRVQIMNLKRTLQRMEADHRNVLNHENHKREGLDAHVSLLTAQMQLSNIVAQPPVANSGGFPFDSTAQNPIKPHHHTHASNSLSSGAVASPTRAYTPMDISGLPPSLTPPFAANNGRPPTQQNYVTGPFMGPSADPQDPEDMFKALTAGAPLSPSAKSLIPSALFDEAFDFGHGGAGDSSSSSASHDMYSTTTTTNMNNNNNNQSNTNVNFPPNTDEAKTEATDTAFTAGGTSGPQSPASSSQSRSILSSPRESAQNLIYSSYNMDGVDGRPPTTSAHASPIGGPATLSEEPTHNARFALFSSFQRSRGPRAMGGEGPALGTLKHGQSQSFPRQGDDIDGSKHRRSGWSMFSRSSVGPEVDDEIFSSSGQTAGQINSKTGGLSARSFLPFSMRGSIFAERDAGSPRPSSMASMDMPRPSTDSGSIWGPPGDNGVSNSALAKTSHLWPADHAWSSHNPSRRQSLHGSPSALRTNLASADDKILDQEELQNPETSPSQVGVIGSKPPTGLKANKSLNPAAPTFMANIFRAKGDKDKDKDHKESKSKGKEKAKDKSKGRDKDKDRNKDAERGETPVPGMGVFELPVDEFSPSAPRMSRDGHSLHTQASVADSRESLDYIVSNTASEPNSVGMLSSSKDSESALLKLFRKDSSVKRSLQRIGRTKGTTSIASSERNPSVDQRSSFGDYEDLGDELLLSTSGGRRNGLGLPLTSAPPGSVDSVMSSPSVGTSKSRDGKTKGTGWFSIKKKNREKESLDIDRNSLPSPGYVNGLGVGLCEPDSTMSSLASAASTDDGEKKAW